MRRDAVVVAAAIAALAAVAVGIIATEPAVSLSGFVWAAVFAVAAGRLSA